jgi:choline kinase
MIDFQLEALRAVGVTDIVIVVGYEHEQMVAHCGRSVRYVLNPDYASTNSIYSLHLAAEEMSSDLLLFNCDIIFHPGILRRLLDEPGPSAVAVDSDVPLVAGEMNVAYRADRRIRCISKELDPSRAQAQSVQLARFDAKGARQVRNEVARLVADLERDAFPTSAYGPLISAGELFAVEVGGLPWAEIDSIADHVRVERDVIPRLPDPGA